MQLDAQTVAADTIVFNYDADETLIGNETMRKLQAGLIRHAPRTLIGLLVLGFISACATNPVTGKRELGLVSEQQERQIGAQSYAPSIQMQGGSYDVDPELSAYVNQVGQRLAQHSDRPLDYEFVVLNNSVPNAWALPGGKIAINRGLLMELNSESELAAVLGHEITHAAARHGAKGMERGLLLQGAIVATAVATRDSDYSQYAVGGASVAAQLLNQRYGRNAELESDYYGMQYMAEAGYNPQGAVDLQETFLRLSEGRRSDWLSGLFASHPPSAERVAANQQTAAELSRNGERGVEEYQRAMAYLTRMKPAYDQYDDARKLLADSKPREAVTLINQAIRTEPKEALFHGFLGDLEFARGDYNKATQHYSRALDLNDQYFKFYLGRGESYRNLNKPELAKRDLEKSRELLPTADAMTSLGLIAEGQGQTDQALAYYQVASESKTPAGSMATTHLVSLDLPLNPQKYIAITKGLDQSGRVYLEFMNQTPVAMMGIEVEFAWIDVNSKQRVEKRRYAQPVDPGARGLIMLGGDPYSSAYNSLQYRISKAAVAR